MRVNTKGMDPQVVRATLPSQALAAFVQQLHHAGSGEAAQGHQACSELHRRHARRRELAEQAKPEPVARARPEKEEGQAMKG